MELTRRKQWALTQIIYQKVLEELDGHFRGCRISYMPIKGAYLICSGLSAKMPVRKMQDIDVLVNEQDMRKASDYFRQMSAIKMKCYYKDNYRQTETSFMYPVGNSYVQVEIHSALNFDERFLLPAATLFSRSRAENEFMRLPSPEDALLIHLCHLQSHIPLEFRQGTFEEIRLLVSQEGFSWRTFWRDCLPTGIEAFIYFMLRVYAKNSTVPLNPSRHYWYSIALSWWFTEERYARLPGIARRLIFDIPFVRRPLWLVFYKLFHQKKAKNLARRRE